MPNLLQRLRTPQTETRFTFDDYMAQWNSALYAGGLVGGGLQQTYDGHTPVERGDGSFEGRAQGIYKANGVVFACQAARMMLFTEARFAYQKLVKGRPGDLWSDRTLQILETPWTNGSTGDLLARMLQHVDLAGNAFVHRTGPMSSPALELLRPDWVTIILGSESGLHTPQIVGYAYEPRGPGSNPIYLDRSEVAHWAPIPDPTVTYRGMSWLSPIIREIRADSQATSHKEAFFQNHATPNMVIKFDASKTIEQVEKFKAMFEQNHSGVRNAYKALYLGGGADVTTAGLNFQQMDFKAVQGAGETRIAAAAGVPPVIVGLSEGLAAATYSNYGQARRRLVDMTMRPLWRSAAAALSTIVPAQSGSRLWYDDRDIPALKEDQKDAADIESVKATTIATLVRDGFEPDSVVAAVVAQDMTLLQHTGLMSVQLLKTGDPNALEPGVVKTAVDPAGATP